MRARFPFVGPAAVAAAALVLAACMARTGPSAPPPASAASSGAARVPAEMPAGPAARLLAAVNATRAAHHLSPLQYDARLARMAEMQARSMAERDYFAHRGPNGEGLTARLGQVGYAYSFAAENLSAGPKSAAEAVAGWMQSPPHRRNLLAREAVAAGTGYAFEPHDDGNASFGTYWVLEVAAPAEP